MKRFLLTTLVALAALNTAHATGPVAELPAELFDYSDPGFAGANFVFGTQLVSFTLDENNETSTLDTGLRGFVKSPAEVGQITVPSGVPIPLGSQTTGDLFGDQTPTNSNGVSAENAISGVGDFQNGFSEVSVHQRTFADARGFSDNLFDLIFAGAFGLAVFEAGGGDAALLADVLITLDTLAQFSGEAAVSQGIEVQLLDLSDLDNPSLMWSVVGDYGNGASFEQQFLDFATNDGTDLNANFALSPTGNGEEMVATFSLDERVELQEGATYGLAVFSNVGADAPTDSVATIDSTSTLDVTLRLVDPAARLFLPGGAVVPEPAAAALLVIGLGAAGARRGGRQQ